MSRETYQEKFEKILSDNPALAVEIHMETREARDRARERNKIEEIRHGLAEKNIKLALRSADCCIDLERMLQAYYHIIEDLEASHPEKLEEYREYTDWIKVKP